MFFERIKKFCFINNLDNVMIVLYVVGLKSGILIFYLDVIKLLIGGSFELLIGDELLV